MTTEGKILECLYSKELQHDEIVADLERFCEADLTENESVAFLRDIFSRLMHDPSRSPKQKAEWEQLARAFEARLGNS